MTFAMVPLVAGRDDRGQIYRGCRTNTPPSGGEVLEVNRSYHEGILGSAELRSRTTPKMGGCGPVCPLGQGAAATPKPPNDRKMRNVILQKPGLMGSQIKKNPHRYITATTPTNTSSIP